MEMESREPPSSVIKGEFILLGNLCGNKGAAVTLEFVERKQERWNRRERGQVCNLNG